MPLLLQNKPIVLSDGTVLAPSSTESETVEVGCLKFLFCNKIYISSVCVLWCLRASVTVQYISNEIVSEDIGL